jgi:DNA ligase-associated metallophosphoesterase
MRALFQQFALYYTATMHIEVAGELLQLLPQRAAVWPAARTLLIADAHFGKAAAFRAKGVPVPRGTTAANLATLAQLVHAYGARELIFLGDFLHARAARADATLAALREFRAQHPALAMTLVRGNHDDHAGDPPLELRIDVVNEPLLRGPFALCHVPQQVPGSYALAGHIHPCVWISSGMDGARLPCYWFGEHTGVLPAFGAFTGAYRVSPQPHDRIFAVAEDTVLQVPAHLLVTAA